MIFRDAKISFPTEYTYYSSIIFKTARELQQFTIFDKPSIYFLIYDDNKQVIL